jgi:exopolysaccharide biosynthesis polyprenyl glycosylphosphotransferase
LEARTPAAALLLRGMSPPPKPEIGATAHAPEPQRKRFVRRSELFRDPDARVSLFREVPVPALEGVGAAATPLRVPLREVPSHTPLRRDTRGYWLRRLLLAGDVLALCVSFLLAKLLSGLAEGGDPPLGTDVLLFLASVPVWLLFAHAHNLYHLDSKRTDHGVTDELWPVLQMTTLWSWSILVLVSLTNLRMIPIERLVVFWALTVVFLLAFRALVRVWARRRTWYLQNALIVAPRDQAATIVQKVLRHPEYGIHVVACIDPTKQPMAEADAIGPVPVIGGRVDVARLADTLEVERVIMSHSATGGGPGSELVMELTESNFHVDLIPEWSDAVSARLELYELEGAPFLTVPRVRLQRSALLCKRALDLAVSATALLLLAPVLLAISLAIKLGSPGPVLFRQRRVGKGDRCFQLFKFRTMYVDADARKAEVAALNFHGGGNDSGMFKIREDPRITRVGSLLRRSSLDELPQLINILLGHMSLVGPRPLIENEDRQVQGRLRRRLNLPPGLTGLWQVNGRSEIPFDEMVNLDYLYVINWSLWSDVKLLLKTFSAVFGQRGAY